MTKIDTTPEAVAKNCLALRDGRIPNSCGELADLLEAIAVERDYARDQCNGMVDEANKLSRAAKAAEAERDTLAAKGGLTMNDKLIKCLQNLRDHGWRAEFADQCWNFADDILAALRAAETPQFGAGWRFAIGDRVEKEFGSEWHGRVCGFYSTPLTPRGYCVESEREPGSVQIYPQAALLPIREEVMPHTVSPRKHDHSTRTGGQSANAAGPHVIDERDAWEILRDAKIAAWAKLASVLPFDLELVYIEQWNKYHVEVGNTVVVVVECYQPYAKEAAQFFIAAREAVPRLIAEVERLNAALAAGPTVSEAVAAEREACAKVADSFGQALLAMWDRPGGPPGNGYTPLQGKHVAAAIRARGEGK
jgi:hypothetical protein